MGSQLASCESFEFSADAPASKVRGKRHLGEAILERSNDFRTMLQPCANADAAGLDASQIAELRRKARQIRAEESLDTAEHAGDALGMECACAEADAAGVERRKVAAVSEKARHLRALSNLHMARSSWHSGCCAGRAVCREAGLAVIHATEAVPLQHHDQQLRAEASLAAAEQRKDVESLRHALLNAQYAGLSNQRLTAANDRLWWVIAESKLDEAELGNDVEVMKLAKKQTQASCTDLGQAEVVRRKAAQGWARAEAADKLTGATTDAHEWASAMIRVPPWPQAAKAAITDDRVAVARRHAHARFEARLQASEKGASAEEMEGVCMLFGLCGRGCVLYM